MELIGMDVLLRDAAAEIDDALRALDAFGVPATSAIRMKSRPGFVPCASRARYEPGRTVTL